MKYKCCCSRQLLEAEHFCSNPEYAKHAPSHFSSSLSGQDGKQGIALLFSSTTVRVFHVSHTIENTEKSGGFRSRELNVPVQNIFFLTMHYLNSFASIAPASWAGSRAGSLGPAGAIPVLFITEKVGHLVHSKYRCNRCCLDRQRSCRPTKVRVGMKGTP